MKKFFSFILATVLILSTFSIFASAEIVENDVTLQFNSDGKFKILHICDIQDTNYCAPQTLDYIARTCDAEKPDLVVLGGDMIASGTASASTVEMAEFKVKWAFENYMSIFEERNIPTALVFGNHDGKKMISEERQMEIYNTYDCCIAVDDGADLYGCGTYNIPIKSSDGKKVAYNIWCFDSNAYCDDYCGNPDCDSYDYVRDDQVNWYLEKSNELKAANGGQLVPSLAFQHIPVPETLDAIENGKLIAGAVNEEPQPSEHYSKQFPSMVKQGDVKAIFTGHDHFNTFEIEYKGINLVGTPTAGFSAGGDENRGIRVIEIDENDTSTYKTRLVNYLKTYCTDEVELCRYKMNAKEFGTFISALNGIRYCYKSLANGKSFSSIFYEIMCKIN